MSWLDKRSPGEWTALVLIYFFVCAMLLSVFGCSTPTETEDEWFTVSLIFSQREGQNRLCIYSDLDVRDATLWVFNIPADEHCNLTRRVRYPS
jgi:hypothetical protein